ncbi:4-hydroxythreonine-4-phosphate dehydrogenase PdxA [Caldovatus aquaticus]|uniref:4-hydroxythreonine-4-phosphate dehydrogenase n=1 Tax=Caldovatus aquaticus TaxID=2865671 RepID=A0ABS7F0C8_9PROT|nr:4-hydroxythreonine-4-phosphate dehydrogenase PdxA [Caldovatus aquaticus]MBW8269090.1 4-hydroxythreonine-4-phosphate dehydrogenase PdxA [Caldovatus aquaticus]
MPPLPPLALTMGEPAGIGAEIAAGAWAALRTTGPAFVFLGDATQIAGVPVVPVAAAEQALAVFPHALPVLHRPLPAPVVPGRPDPANAPAVIGAIDEAVALAKAGRVAGVVTNPIQKATLYAAGFRHPGHTEYLGEIAGTPGGGPPVMMLACAELRTVPVTGHEPLARAIARLTPALIVRHALVTAEALRRDFGIAAPRLAVAGLNPHAGEDGTLGTEDRAIVAPAVAALQAKGIAARGPLPPDTLFTPLARPTYDAAICLYHDQALIPVKTLDMAGGVNVTLGLSIVRTSPDHGTALDIAGQGRADPSSLIAALRMAAAIARQRSLAP